MPTKKASSPKKTRSKSTSRSTKKATKSRKSTTSTSKKKTVKAKKTTTKKTVSKKTASKKKPAKRPTTAKKKTAKKSTTKKKAVKKSIPVQVVSDEKQQLHVFPKKRTLINQLPVIDLDELHVTSMKTGKKEEAVETIAVHSRLAFYLGVFMGAVVVNAFLVTILAVMSV